MLQDKNMWKNCLGLFSSDTQPSLYSDMVIIHPALSFHKGSGLLISINYKDLQGFGSRQLQTTMAVSHTAEHTGNVDSEV